MQVSAENRYGKCRAQVTGEVTIYSAVELKTRLGELLAGTDDVELSLAQVTEFDSAGVQLLLWFVSEASRRRVNVRVADHSAVVEELVALYNLANDIGMAAGARGAA